MIDLGTVQPGSTIRIPFSTFNTAGAAVTMTNFAAADILIYKDGSTTERASTSGFTATTDFDSKTGKQLAIIDLSDNTTADFYAAGSEYLVAIDSVTVDSQTVGTWVARFKIGYREAIFDTTIATLSSQASFTLTTGPTDDSALVGCIALIHDAASAVQRAIGVVSAYTGSTKTVTLAADPAIFTMAAKDNISFFVPSNTRFVGGTAQTAKDLGAINVTNLNTLSGHDPGATLASQTNITAGTITTVGTVNALATDSINSNALAASAVTELQSGLATSSALAAVQADTDDIQARLPAALTSNGNLKVSLQEILTTALTETSTGYLAAAYKKLFDVAAPVLTAASVNQTGDSFARIGATGSGLTSLAPSATALSTAQWTNARAGYLDTLSTGVTLATSQPSVGFTQFTVNSVTLANHFPIGFASITIDPTYGIGVNCIYANGTLFSTAVTSPIAAIAADNPNTPTKNVALSNLVFTMVDATDFNTPETGVTVTAQISKDGGSFANCTNSVSEISGGFYKISLTSTEMNCDAVALKFTGTGCAQRNFSFRTQPT